MQRLGKRVMAGHLVLLAAFLVQAEPPGRTLRLQIFHLHRERRRDARERIGKSGDQRAVAQIAHGLGRNAVHKLAPLVGVEHRRLSGFDDMIRTPHGGGRIKRHHLAGDEPVEQQHPHGGKLLLHARHRVVLAQVFDPGCHIDRPDGREREATIVAPCEKCPACAGVSTARVRVLDVGGEEFDVAPAGGAAGMGDERRHYIGVGRGRECTGWDDGGELIGHRASRRRMLPRSTKRSP